MIINHHLILVYFMFYHCHASVTCDQALDWCPLVSTGVQTNVSSHNVTRLRD